MDGHMQNSHIPAHMPECDDWFIHSANIYGTGTILVSGNTLMNNTDKNPGSYGTFILVGGGGGNYLTKNSI